MASTQENNPSGVAQSRLLTSARLRCFGLTSRERFTPDIKNPADLQQFCIDQRCRIPTDRCARLIRNYRKRFGGGYCCQRRVNRLLNSRVHILGWVLLQNRHTKNVPVFTNLCESIRFRILHQCTMFFSPPSRVNFKF